MIESGPGAEVPVVDWSEWVVSGLLPTGTVTLLLADVEGSTRLWQSDPEAMAAAIARLDVAVGEIVAAHGGVRPLEQGEGEGFVVAFARGSDAVGCALDVQRAPVAPIRLRIGVHTGEVQLRDAGNYVGPVINCTARLRDVAHGGQTVLSGTTADLVADGLGTQVWLRELGVHALRDVARPQRVVQLCHPDLGNDFPPLRTTEGGPALHLPVQLTSFVGRREAMTEVRALLTENRLVTLTGAGGVGKTRLAIEVTATMAAEFTDGVWYVDLAPITDPALVAVTMARALGLPDQPGRTTMEVLLRFVGERQMLVVLDNCEHLLDACAELVVALLGGAGRLCVLATSREPIGVAGEATRRVPSLSLASEAVELFTDRARLALTGFTVTQGNAAVITEICTRLDGVPLAIELAAARVRALSVGEILGSLHDRFRLLTGGARTAVRRQQTLRASVDWSHALLTEPERTLFRRLAAFLGGFDLDAAQEVGQGGGMQRHQVLDQLSLLVDKSLVLAEDTGTRTRYRMLETMRQYALEKLGESGEADAVRTRHRDHYTRLAARLDAPAGTNYEQRVEQAALDFDNLRAAFTWSRENADTESALTLASSLQPLWQARGRLWEGLTWFNTALADLDAPHPEVSSAVRAGALADSALIAMRLGLADGLEQAQHALMMARDIDDPALLVRALTACAYTSIAQNAALAGPHFAEAIDLARALGDPWRLSQILTWRARGAHVAGDLILMRAAAEEGRDLADAIGDRWLSRQCRWFLAWAQLLRGDPAGAAARFGEMAVEAEADHDAIITVNSLAGQGLVLAWQGDAGAARAVADAAADVAAELGGAAPGVAYTALAGAALIAGDFDTAQEASEKASQHLRGLPVLAATARGYGAHAALASGDVTAARSAADDGVTTATGWWQMLVLTTRARVTIAQGEPDQAERDAHDALAIAASMQALWGIPDILECLATLAAATDGHREAVRLFGAAHATRQHMGAVRFKIWEAGYEVSVAAVREALGEKDFDSAWAEGAALSTEEVIAYAQRGRGQRKRPTTGWASLTPTEQDVVGLVTEGLANKDIAVRLFVSPRTVQTHLTHVYTKLGLTSRVQLVQEAARHN